MFTKKNETESMLDTEIQALLVELKDIPKDTDKYGVVLDRISKLHKLKAEESPKKISPDTALVVAANIVGILAILNYEHLHPITSKATGFIIKP